ncbi:MAG TPA: sigma-70 family RNA polymerase sigma factor, partial [Actinotalea sp.]|nr:sigma-70 family RNA polymerase sigma factor [Actinotalea sp.]
RRRLWHRAAPLLADRGPGRDPGTAAGERVDLRAAMAELTPQERAAVVLRYYSDLTVPEVAREMGLAEGTVKRYLSSAVHKLESQLGPVAPAVESAPVLVSDREGQS